MSQDATFIGREVEVSEIVGKITSPDCRLLTLVGVGGIGKSRLAVKVAGESLLSFTHCIYFVALQAVVAAELLASTVADALRFSPGRSEPPETQRLNDLQDKEMLLVLENLEHLLTQPNIDFIIAPLTKYFDATFYIANWGSCLMFRLPKRVVDLAQMRAYCQPLIIEEFLSISTQGEYVILNIE